MIMTIVWIAVAIICALIVLGIHRAYLHVQENAWTNRLRAEAKWHPFTTSLEEGSVIVGVMLFYGEVNFLKPLTAGSPYSRYYRGVLADDPVVFHMQILATMKMTATNIDGEPVEVSLQDMYDEPGLQSVEGVAQKLACTYNSGSYLQTGVTRLPVYL